MIDEKQDLTISAVFAAEHNPNLLLREAYNSWREIQNPAKGFETNRGLISILMTAIALPPILHEETEFDHLETASRIWGENDPTTIALHKQLDPYAYAYGQQCDRCGTDLNCLTIAKYYGICQSCDSEMELEREYDEQTDF